MDEFSPSSPGRSVQDEGLRCLRCNYNLTGVGSKVCPECGKRFRIEHLRALLAGVAWTRIPFWSGRTRGRRVKAFLLTAFAITIRPVQFARVMFRFPNADDAQQFRNAAHLTALLPLTVACVALSLNHVYPPIIVIPLIAWITARLCELFEYGVWRRAVRHHPRAKDYATVLTCLTSHHLAMTVGACFFSLAVQGFGSVSVLSIVLGGPLVLWWADIVWLAWGVTGRVKTTAFVAAAVPLCATVSIGTGVLLARITFS
jgi:hypothetical protein